VHIVQSEHIGQWATPHHRRLGGIGRVYCCQQCRLISVGYSSPIRSRVLVAPPLFPVSYRTDFQRCLPGAYRTMILKITKRLNEMI